MVTTGPLLLSLINMHVRSFYSVSSSRPVGSFQRFATMQQTGA
jgi:hypothetical protein